MYCPICGRKHETKGTYDTDACRQKAYRLRKKGVELPYDPATGVLVNPDAFWHLNTVSQPEQETQES